MQYSTTARNSAAALLGLALCLPVPAYAASDQEVEELKRAIQELRTRNQELSQRLSALEGERPPRRPPAPPPPAPPPQATARGEAPPPATAPVPSAAPASRDQLEQRVQELEIAKRAQEDAVRTIVQDSLSKVGPKINEFVTLGGAIEVLAGRSSDFTGRKRDEVTISAAELDFEIRVNEWMVGNLQLQYDSGTSVLFPTTTGFNTGVDRVTVDRATVLIGDVQRFPLYAEVGRDVLPFGISTGSAYLDTLSVESPLTVQVFETRRNFVGIGFALPTPEARPPSPPVIVPPVRPLAISPLVDSVAKAMGYVPPPRRPRPPTPFAFAPDQPPFYGSLQVYDANTVEGVDRRFSSSFSGRLGYRTKGNCGRPYSELTDSWLCPWALDVSVDYLSSVFDSRFLESEYQAFIPQIGTVPGVAASIKFSFGPFLLVGEWNSAVKRARFVDDAGRQVNIMPASWQVSLGYQFDWNPWVETIGTQGTYVAVGYSKSQGLSGVTQLIGGTPTRVGFVPESRLLLTAGEWVADGARLAVEYAHNWDYPRNKGGTGRQADGIFMVLTYVW